MGPHPGRRWLIGAVAVFLVLLLGWVVLALQLNVASAGPLPYSPLLVSRLSVDYGADSLPLRIASLRLTIVEDAMRAMGMSDAEVEQHNAEMELAMSQPVPTATARDFEGGAPLTATPTFTAVPTETPEPTATASATHRLPTHTKTAKPTKTPRPRRTATPSGGDSEDPEILGYASLVANPVGACEISWTVDDLHVVDDAPSSGISWVKFKYEVPGYVGLTYLNQLSLDCGGPSGGGWDGCYDGSSGTIEIEDGWAGDPPMNTGPSDFEIILYAKAHDGAGNEVTLELDRYTMPHTCDDPDT